MSRGLRFIATASISLAAGLLLTLHAGGQQPHVAPTPGQPLTPVQFAARLDTFDRLVTACQAAPSSVHCPKDQVEATLQLQLPSGARGVSFLWLRAILDEAANPPKSDEKSDKNKAAKAKSSQKKAESDPEDDEDEIQLDQIPSIQERLTAARQRLAAERTQALSASPAAPPPASTSSSDASRHTLTAILAGKDYHSVSPTRTLTQRILEKIQSWLTRFFHAISEAGRGKRWISLLAEVGFIAILLLALAWFLIRLERQGRLVNATLAPGLGAASARDWQLWLEDARQAANRHAWRDAVHYLYWSSISRLESSGLWAADRARTPREYLALLAPAHAQRPALLALTRTFERTWYAGRPASESDYLLAEQQVGQLSARRSQQKEQPALEPFVHEPAEKAGPQ